MLCVIPDNKNVLIYANCKIRIRTSFTTIQDAKFGSISKTDAKRTRERKIVKMLDAADTAK